MNEMTPLPQTTEERMALVHAAAWGQWPSVKEMAADLGSGEYLYKLRKQGDLPPSDLWEAILQRAAQAGSPLTSRDLVSYEAWRRQQKSLASS